MIYGILSEKYSNYITKFAREQIDWNYATILFKLFWILLAMCCYKKLLSVNPKNETYIFLLIIDLILTQVGAFSSYADRVAYYYGLAPLLCIIGQIDKGFKEDRFNKLTINIISVSLLLFYWYFIFVHFNTGETYPYNSIY